LPDETAITGQRASFAVLQLTTAVVSAVSNYEVLGAADVGFTGLLLQLSAIAHHSFVPRCGVPSFAAEVTAAAMQYLIGTVREAAVLHL
jgi:hypothetical protein